MKRRSFGLSLYLNREILLKPVRRPRRYSARILDIAVPEVRLERSGIDPVIGQPEAAGMAQHPGSAAMAARSIMREKPGGG